MSILATTAVTDRYADWAAPREDGARLIWPGPGDLLAQIDRNRKLLSAADGVRVQNASLPELRRAMRTFIDQPIETPLIATGHQAELYHPGVWVKNVLIDAVARRVGGAGLHVSVDTDAPKHLTLRWPGTAMPLTDDPRLSIADWTGLLDQPTPAHLARLDDALARARRDWSFKPEAGEVLDQLRRLALEPTDLPQALLNACHHFDWSLGLRHHALALSPLLETDPFLAFAHHLIASAGAFVGMYNDALAAYRSEHGITSDTRPMPDLAATPGRVELPFWLDDLEAGVRVRASAVRSEGGWALELPGDTAACDATADASTAADRLREALRARSLRLRPRALTLTMFLRVLVVDQFVHGIGGGRYDQITDRLIERFFGITAPGYAVTTATLFFPDGLRSERVCMPCLLREGHALRHNLLGRRKRGWLDAIAAAPAGSPRRSALYVDMHHALLDAARASRGYAGWQTRLADGRDQLKVEKTLFDRELFYAIQPRDRLIGMIEAYRAQVGA